MVTTQQTVDPLLESVQEYIDQIGGEEGGSKQVVQWLPEFFAQKLSELNARAAAAEARRESIIADANAGYEGTMAEVRARIGGLRWKYMNDLYAVVQTQLEGHHARSINTAYGKIGFRTRKAHEQLVVDDEAQAIRAAEALIPSAVKKSLCKSALMGKIIPGTRMEKVPETEVFYCNKTELETRQADVPLPTQHMSLGEWFGKAFPERTGQ